MCGECNFPGSEFGGNVKFVGHPGAFFQKVTVKDVESNEIDTPKCDKCGYHKATVMGKEAFGWVCMVCHE